VWWTTRWSSCAQVILASRPQQHDFNYPYQLSIDTDGSVIGVTPDQAELYTMTVQEGDLIILMTDGVFDNLSTPSLLNAAELLDAAEPQDIAEAIVGIAHTLSQTSFTSPFHLAAREAGYYYPPRGKQDDITVVVARVEVENFKQEGRSGLRSWTPVWMDKRSKRRRQRQRGLLKKKEER